MGSTDGLYGASVSLATARLVLASAVLKDWAVDVGDVEGAYLVTELRGPPVNVRLPPALWEAAGADQALLRSMRDPCLRVRRAMYGRPRAGFD